MGARQRVAAVHLFSLPMERAFGAASAKALRAVRRLAGGRTVLDDVSPAARAKGVYPGMSQVEARARVPALELRDRDLAGERNMLNAAAEVLLSFSSAIEVVAPDLLLVEIGKSAGALADHGFADEAAVAAEIRARLEVFGHASTLAIADDPDTARALAVHTSSRVLAAAAQRKKKGEAAPDPVRIAAVDGSAAALARLPITSLLWTDAKEDPEGRVRDRLEAAVRSLHVLGVRDIGHLATFSPAQVASRYGDAGALLMARVLGQRSRPLATFSPPEQLTESFELEGSTSDLDPITFVIKRLLDRLETRLFARGMAASALELRFTIDHSRKLERLKVQLARPVRSAKTLLRLCRERIGNALSGSVRAIVIEALAPVPDHGAQLDLFTQHAQRIERVEELIARLQASLGETAVFAAELHDAHRPEAAWNARPFAIEAAFEEPPPPPRRRWVAMAHNEALVRRAPREAYVLPAAGEDLAVVSPAPVSAQAPVIETKSWPKPVKRKKEDDPLTPLPQRPLELLPRPEAARLIDQVLIWRGEKLRVLDVGRRECFECEWWKEAPLDREYVVMELEDGRRLWCFSGTEDSLWIHGVFD